MTDFSTHGLPGDGALVDLLPLFRGRNVLVLGDVMLDRYVLGGVNRISPEAPIPVLRAAGRRAALGGAANVAHNIAALGARATLIGIIGADLAGAEIEYVLATLSDGIVARLVVAPRRPTTVKTRFMAGSHQLLRVDEETTEALDTALAAELLRRFGEALAGSDIVVISDYAKGVLCDAVLGTAIDLARAAGRPVIADPKRATFDAYRNVTLLTPNALEVTGATGVDASDDAGAEKAGRIALEATVCDAVLVTRSEKGMTLVRRGLPTFHLPTRAQEVTDVSGAGDTLVATLATALACGIGLLEAAHLANIAAGICVSKQGTAVVSNGELSQAIHRHEMIAADDKVVALDVALERIRGWRTRGLKIGFTNGCFDLIHPGHVHLLAQARAACDRLVVGLNSDGSVRRLKGLDRPIQNEAARATVLASMASVDLAILFAEDTPLSLIEAIRPDVLIKGADYTVDQVVGAETVEVGGGRVLLVDLYPGESTTRTVIRIKEHMVKAG